MCDDQCPACGASNIEITESEDLSVKVMKNDEGVFEIYYSPASAEDRPDYQFFNTARNKYVAKLMASEAEKFIWP